MAPASWTLPTIHPVRCTGCGLCAELCPTQAVEVHNNLAIIVRPEACSFCDICETYCPEGAIERPFAITYAAADAYDQQTTREQYQPAYSPPADTASHADRANYGGETCIPGTE